MAGIDWVADSDAEQALTKKKKRKVGKKKIEFLDWGSRPLIEFLQAIGKDVTTKHTQREVADLVLNYITSKNLFCPTKKKKVLCDTRLIDLFAKKTITRPKVYDLLEEHFAENHNSSDDESMDSSDEENRPAKKNRPIVPTILQTPKSSFASVISDNIKLLYLRKTLVQEFLKVPESCNIKVVGSFVRMKKDPNDIFQKHRFQLQLVTGVEMDSEVGSEVRLRLANYFKDVPISMLSDEMFTNEEVDDVRERIKAGALKRLVVVELQSKAQLLHADIMQHSIAKELSLLQGRIDHANDKGWRRDLTLFEYLDRRKLLQTPSEVEKLLHNVPEVIAEELEPDAAMVASPRSILRGTSDVSSTDASGSGDLAPRSQLVIDDSPTPRGPTVNLSSDDLVKNPQGCEDVNEVLGDRLKSPTLISKVEEIGPGDTNETSMAEWFKPPIYSSKQVVEIEDEPSDLIQQGTPIIDVVSKQSSELSHGLGSAEKFKPVRATKEILITPVAHSGEKSKQPPPVVIDLLSDDESELDEPKKANDKVSCECRDSEVWHYVDPKGITRGPFSLAMLKQWRDSNYFAPDFTVWKTGQSRKDAVLLADVLGKW